MIVDVNFQIPIDTSGFKKDYSEAFCEELAKLQVNLALKDNELSKYEFSYKAKKDYKKIFEGSKFIKNIIVYSKVENVDYDYYYIEVAHNQFPDDRVSGYESLIRVNLKTGAISGDIGGSYFALKSFETYKEYEKEFDNLMREVIKSYNKK